MEFIKGQKITLSNKLSVNLHYLIKMKHRIFMQLMSDTVTKYMQDGHTNCDIRSETTFKNFVDNINQYFNLYVRNKLVKNQQK